MIGFDAFYEHSAGTPLEPFHGKLRRVLDDEFYKNLHGDMQAWLGVLESLPDIEPDRTGFDTDAVTVGSGQQLSEGERQSLISRLKTFMPWRKGPWSLFGIHIDTEWRSNMKWARIKDHIAPLKGKMVLDVGCGNGYYAYRMLPQGPKFVLGIDPTQLYLLQQRIFASYLPGLPVTQLPLKDDHLPDGMHCFDTVFSMGVIYHRRDPVRHLQKLKGAMVPGGELVLESLVIMDESKPVLIPGGRYAKMRNVWSIPGCDTLIGWLQEAGFVDIKLLDISKTTMDEQRVTPWMEFESLKDFLDPKDENLTVEGLPAPIRALFMARSA